MSNRCTPFSLKLVVARSIRTEITITAAIAPIKIIYAVSPIIAVQKIRLKPHPTAVINAKNRLSLIGYMPAETISHVNSEYVAAIAYTLAGTCPRRTVFDRC